MLPGLLVVAILLCVAGYGIWPGFRGTGAGEAPVGGVLLLHDLLPFDDDGVDVAGVRAEVQVRMWSTGYPEVSIAELEIEFESPRVDDRWYVIASGDWAVSAERDLSLYCAYGDGRMVGDRIECAAQAGNAAMAFRFDQELSNFTPDDQVTKSVRDYDGYDSDRVAVVSGAMPEKDAYGRSAVTVWLPIATPSILSVSGDDFFALPPVGWFDSSYGSGPPLGEKCDSPPTPLWALFMLTKTCAPVTYISVTNTSVDSGIELGNRAVEYASPDTVSDDALRWSVEGGFPGGRALVSDPFAQADESRRAFFAALVLSGGVSFLLLFAERWLFHGKSSRRERSAS